MFCFHVMWCCTALPRAWRPADAGCAGFHTFQETSTPNMNWISSHIYFLNYISCANQTIKLEWVYDAILSGFGWRSNSIHPLQSREPNQTEPYQIASGNCRGQLWALFCVQMQDDRIASTGSDLSWLIYLHSCMLPEGSPELAAYMKSFVQESSLYCWGTT